MKKTMIKSENLEQFLSFKQVPVQEITFDQLRNSNHERLSNGEAPFQCFHSDFIQQVRNICSEHGLNTRVDQLFAADKGPSVFPGVSLSQPLIERYGENAVKATTLRRVFCNLRITDFDTDEFTTNLAIAYTQKGIQVAIGTMVKICTNQTILGREQYAATFQRKDHGEKLTADQILNIVAGWIENIRITVINDRRIIDGMKNIFVTEEELYKIIGMLQARRVAYDTGYNSIKNREALYPLNGTQLNTFTEQVLLKLVKQELTLWDVYNCATEVYKAFSMDFINVMPQNIEMVAFLDKLYGFKNRTILLHDNNIQEAVVVA